MIIANLLSQDIEALNETSTVAEGMMVMGDFHIRHLPVVEHGVYRGIINEDTLLDSNPSVKVLPLLPIAPPSTFVRRADHVYDAVKLFVQQQISLIPVLDEQDNYVGVVTLEQLLMALAEMGSFNDPGSIVVLEMGRHDYSLSEIARIVEEESAIILSSSLQSFSDSNRVQVTIKLNGERVGAILASFERFDYHIKASFNEVELQSALKERYDSLMNYLNI